jgi:hypothetical protein
MVDSKLEEKSQSEAATSAKDDGVLRELGIRRELKREFSMFSTVSFALGIYGYVKNSLTFSFYLSTIVQLCSFNCLNG